MGVEKPWPPSGRKLVYEDSTAKQPEQSEYSQDKPCICPKEPKSPEQHQPPPQQPGSGQPEEPQDSYETCPLCNGTTPEPKPPYYYYEPSGGYLPTYPSSET